ncbi:MAG: hypothetical protein M1445_06130 [Bacteroidetes bacterium]|nr:hypothetical protein [Bacteroidota bacterium]
MAILSWGKPKIEVVVAAAGAVPVTPTWITFPEIKENTAKLTPTKGTKTEAIAEGGEIVDIHYQKNKFTFECEVFLKKGSTRPIADVDGHIIDNYCLRLTPEDITQEGWIMENTSVSCEESWTSADGKMLKYTFDGLKPAAGNMLKPYTQV